VDNLEFLDDLLSDAKSATSGKGSVTNFTPRTQALLDGKVTPRTAYASPSTADVQKRKAALFGPRPSAPNSARSSAPGSARGNKPPLPTPLEVEETRDSDARKKAAGDKLKADLGFDLDELLEDA
jgi:hypothetical protein